MGVTTGDYSMKFEAIYEWNKDEFGIPAEVVDAYLLDGGMIAEFDDSGKFVRIVGTGGGEPEDNTLARDYSWVVVELNKLAEQIKQEFWRGYHAGQDINEPLS